VCGLKLEKDKLIRVVRRPAGELALDPVGHMHGRGAYVCGKDDCWDQAVAGGAFARSLGLKGGALLRDRLIEIRDEHSKLDGPP
jgi:predicted RNA-binding protein YlxR (DUF448 family)